MSTVFLRGKFGRVLATVAVAAAIGALNDAPAGARMMGGAKLTTLGIPGNIIAVGTAADNRYESLRDTISAATLGIKSLNSPTATQLTAQVNIGRRAIDRAVRNSARRLDNDVDRRVNLLWRDSSINWRQVLQVDLLRDRLITELYDQASAAKADLRSYANDRAKTLRLANKLAGVYDVTVDGDTSGRTIARISLEPDFRVLGLVFNDELGAAFGREATMDLDASFANDEVLRGVRWYVVKGKVVIAGPHFRTSASASTKTRSFTVTGLDLLPEFADAVVNNPISNAEVRRVKNGLRIVEDRLADARLRLTKR